MKDDEEGGFVGIFGALCKRFGVGVAVTIVLGVLAIFIFWSNDNYGPLVRPFLVGHWEANSRLEGNRWIREARPRVLTLYDDGVASLDGLKGNWTFADVSRLAVRIEVPGRDKVSPSKLYELRVQRGDTLSGTMRDSGRVFRFKRLEKGGAVAIVENAIGEAIRKENREKQEAREEACRQTGLRRAAYVAGYWFFTREPLDCDVSGHRVEGSTDVPPKTVE